MNTFGNIFRLTDFGESHGAAIGGVIDGVPAGLEIDMDQVQAMLDRRRPGQSPLTTQRNEADKVVFLSGIFEGKTLGTPIGFMIANSDSRSKDYDNVRNCYRPNHADYTYDAKYGIRDHRGGGRSSARETAVRVVAGAIAKQILRTQGIDIQARAIQIGQCTNPEKFDTEIAAAKQAQDSVGAIVACTVTGAPAGLGEPVFGKLQAMLAAAMMSINAAKGFEYGIGFRGASMHGSEVVDSFYTDADGKVKTRTNFSGGIQGGISNGQDIYFNVAFKPIATITRELDTIDSAGNTTTLKVNGRHDPCVAPRAVVVVEAMAAITILDALMMARATKFDF